MSERIGFGLYHLCGNRGSVGRLGCGGMGGVDDGVLCQGLGGWVFLCLCVL